MIKLTKEQVKEIKCRKAKIEALAVEIAEIIGMQGRTSLSINMSEWHPAIDDNDGYEAEVIVGIQSDMVI